MTAHLTNGVISGWSPLLLGAGMSRHQVSTRGRHTSSLWCYVIRLNRTSRHQIGTRERPRHTSLLRRYVIRFNRTSRHQIGTRERLRHTSLLGRYVIRFKRMSRRSRKPVFLLTIARILYLLYESSSPNPTLKDIKLT